jgi:hypothetical protein
MLPKMWKTSRPLICPPRHDLSAKCRTLDLEQSQKLLDMLNSQGATP